MSALWSRASIGTSDAVRHHAFQKEGRQRGPARIRQGDGFQSEFKGQIVFYRQLLEAMPSKLLRTALRPPETAQAERSSFRQLCFKRKLSRLATRKRTGGYRPLVGGMVGFAS